MENSEEKRNLYKKYITNTLFAKQDIKYRDFYAKLIPNIKKSSVIGVRILVLRAFAKEINSSGNADVFLCSLPHEYYDENCLHAIILSLEKDFDVCIKRITEFLPFIDNWSVCDILRPVCFAKNKDRLLPFTQKLIASDLPYSKRFGTEMQLVHFLDDSSFSQSSMKQISLINSDCFYVKTAVAWYFAEALSKQFPYARKYIEEKKLPKDIHRMAVRKALESRKTDAKTKEWLKKQI